MIKKYSDLEVDAILVKKGVMPYEHNGSINSVLLVIFTALSYIDDHKKK